MSNGGSYRADNKVSINNIAELNLICGALQDELGALYRAAHNCERRSETLARPLRIKAVAISKLLDRLRVGWKGADAIPEEIQQQLAAREDTRFWSKPGELLEQFELAAIAEIDTTDESLSLFTVYPF